MSTIDEAFKKRTKIILVYIIIFLAVVFLIRWILTPAATCNDGIKNQSETGIDCGGVCGLCKEIKETHDLQVEAKAFTSGGANIFDMVAKVNNPNDSIGASSFDYVFTLLDSSGKTIATKTGTSYILPSDTRYVAELGISTQDNISPSSINFSISNVKWAKLNFVEKPEFTIFNKKFGPLQNGTLGSEAVGVLRNDSVYDLANIKVVAVLRDAENNIVGIGSTQVNTVRGKEEREMHFQWPFMTGENVQSLDIDAQSNVFDSKNLIQGK